MAGGRQINRVLGCRWILVVFRNSIFLIRRESGQAALTKGVSVRLDAAVATAGKTLIPNFESEVQAGA
jgi:hypothetical protein